jgi:hypothetical protein
LGLRRGRGDVPEMESFDVSLMRQPFKVFNVLNYVE